MMNRQVIDLFGPAIIEDQITEDPRTDVFAIFCGTTMTIGDGSAHCDPAFNTLQASLRKSLGEKNNNIHGFDGCMRLARSGGVYAFGTKTPADGMIEELKKTSGPIRLHLSAQSRGCISAYDLCLRIQNDPLLAELAERLEVHLDLRDPVPGNLDNTFADHVLKNINVAHLYKDLRRCEFVKTVHVSIQEELSGKVVGSMCRWMIPTFHPGTKLTVEGRPGHHMATQRFPFTMDGLDHIPIWKTVAQGYALELLSPFDATQRGASSAGYALSQLRAVGSLIEHSNLSPDQCYSLYENTLKKLGYTDVPLLASKQEMLDHLIKLRREIYQVILRAYQLKNLGEITAFCEQYRPELLSASTQQLYTQLGDYPLYKRSKQHHGHQGSGFFGVSEKTPDVQNIQFVNAEHARLAGGTGLEETLFSYHGDRVDLWRAELGPADELSAPYALLVQDYARDLAEKNITTLTHDFNDSMRQLQALADNAAINIDHRTLCQTFIASARDFNRQLVTANEKVLMNLTVKQMHTLLSPSTKEHEKQQAVTNFALCQAEMANRDIFNGKTAVRQSRADAIHMASLVGGILLTVVGLSVIGVGVAGFLHTGGLSAVVATPLGMKLMATGIGLMGVTSILGYSLTNYSLFNKPEPHIAFNDQVACLGRRGKQEVAEERVLACP